MMLHETPIDSPNQLRSLCEQWSEEPFLALDTEFIRETTFFPQIALIQVATKKEAWLIDSIRLSAVDLKPFFDVLANPKVLKILHASASDRDCLYLQYGIDVVSFYDTAVAGSFLGYGDQPSLAKLIEGFLGIELGKSLARSHWDRRPLSQDLALYALHDVSYLVELRDRQIGLLKRKKMLAWFQEAMASVEEDDSFKYSADHLYERMSKNMSLKPRNALALQALIHQREAFAKELDVPRRRICDDSTLIDLCKAMPSTLDDWQKFRGLKYVSTKRWHQAFLQWPQLDPHQEAIAPAREVLKKLTPQEQIQLDFITFALKLYSQQEGIAPRWIATVSELDHFVRCRRKGFNLARQVFRFHQARPIHEDLWSLLNGRRALTLTKKGVQSLPVNE